MSTIDNLHKTDEINKIFDNRYSEEVLKKIKHFYFNEDILKNETTKLENACHVSIFYFYFIN